MIPEKAAPGCQAILATMSPGSRPDRTTILRVTAGRIGGGANQANSICKLDLPHQVRNAVKLWWGTTNKLEHQLGIFQALRWNAESMFRGFKKQEKLGSVLFAFPCKLIHGNAQRVVLKRAITDKSIKVPLCGSVRFLLLSGLVWLAALPVSAQTHLERRERETPICRALADQLRSMPPDTDGLTWTRRLDPIRGVTFPVWTKLDAAEHLDVIYAAAHNYGWQDLRAKQPLTPRQLAARERTEVRLRAGIATGEVLLEETSVPTVELAATPENSELMHLYRVTEWTWSERTVGGPRRQQILQPAWILLIKSMPTTTHFDLRTLNNVTNTGVSSSMDVIVVDGRPLFIGMPRGVVRRYFLSAGILETQLVSTATDNPTCDLAFFN